MGNKDAKWLETRIDLFKKKLASLKQTNPTHWAIFRAEVAVVDGVGNVLALSQVHKIVHTQAEAEAEAVKYGELCIIADLATGKYIDRWYNR